VDPEAVEAMPNSFLNAGSMQSNSLHLPIMDLTYEGQVYRRSSSTVDDIGSPIIAWGIVGGVVPCDVQPMTDDLTMMQTGQTEVYTHTAHFTPGANVKVGDTFVVLTSKTGYGPIGQAFFINELLQPSDILSYIRCRCTFGKDPTA
jgi:hypothetical protein